MRIWSVAPLAAAIVGASGGSAFCDSATRISGPHVHENLAVYFVHGQSAPGPVPLTLEEALAKNAVQVIETDRVNELQIENVGSEPVFIQSGDIVKGGKQDRVLTLSLLLVPNSGRALPVHEVDGEVLIGVRARNSRCRITEGGPAGGADDRRRKRCD